MQRFKVYGVVSRLRCLGLRAGKVEGLGFRVYGFRV